MIALCINLEALQDGGYRSPEACRPFIGAAWMPQFVQMAEAKGLSVFSGKQALAMVKDHPSIAQEISVIQEEGNAYGEGLRVAGARSSALFCLESPLYAPLFYDHQHKHPRHFGVELLFDNGTHHIDFPRSQDEAPQDRTYSERKLLTMISANKSWRGMPDLSASPAWTKAVKRNLQDYRFQAVEYYKTVCDEFDLYGHGWPSGVGEVCADKLDTLTRYKFALCFENVEWPGYITEKIIDCLAAGCIPIYRGAPDIQKYIPNDLYIDARYFSTFGQILSHIHAMPEKSWLAYNARIADWGQHLHGNRYTNEGFARNLLNHVTGKA